MCVCILDRMLAFICVHNSCRSQIAEALGKHLASDVFESYSAGTETKSQIPDFTILDVKGRTEKYLEHFGMMGDIDYVNNMVLKISSYEQNNIFLGDRLICTFESA